MLVSPMFESISSIAVPQLKGHYLCGDGHISMDRCGVVEDPVSKVLQRLVWRRGEQVSFEERQLLSHPILTETPLLL